MLSRKELVARYVAFTVVATAVNLGFQHVSLFIYRGSLPVAVSILAGTGSGFLCKYVLDKRFIFFDPTRAAAHEVGQVALYGVTGVVTTLLFWACELGLWRAIGADWAKDLGGIIGLTVGYWVKYQLDRRFVFGREAPA